MNGAIEVTSPAGRSNELLSITDDLEFSRGLLGHVHEFIDHARDQLGPGEYLDLNISFKLVPDFSIRYGKVDKV